MEGRCEHEFKGHSWLAGPSLEDSKGNGASIGASRLQDDELAQLFTASLGVARSSEGLDM